MVDYYSASQGGDPPEINLRRGVPASTIGGAPFVISTADGAALLLDGSDDYLQYAVSGAPANAAGYFTFLFEFKTTTVNNNDYFCTYGNSAAANSFFGFATQTGGAVELRVFAQNAVSTTLYDAALASSVWNDGEVHRVIARLWFGSGSVSDDAFFIDGEIDTLNLTKASAESFSATTFDILTLGALGRSTIGFWSVSDQLNFAAWGGFLSDRDCLEITRVGLPNLITQRVVVPTTRVPAVAIGTIPIFYHYYQNMRA